MIENGSHLGPYVVRKELGRGITGRVYYGWDHRENVPVALKVLDPDLAKDISALTMFEEEGRAGLAIDSQQIVKTLMLGEQDGYRFIAFEYVHGVPLARLIVEGGMAEHECVWILRHVGLAIRELCRNGIVHQDIKPENILLEKTGNCKLSDLGFARMTCGKIDWDGYAAGTAYYMSPEQCQPWLHLPVDTRSDLYALGGVIYHAATGRPPFEAEDEADVRDKQINEKPLPPRDRNGKLSEYFSDMVLRLLAKDANARFQTPEDLLLELRQLPVDAKAPVVNISQVS